MRGIESGTLSVRLSKDDAEIEAAQALRYRVFYDERSATPSAEMARLRRDFDDFDPYCDHLLVIDRSLGDGAAGVVGTYRLIREPAARAAGGFYTADEYEIEDIIGNAGNVLELGRSCIDSAYRNTATMTLLWRGIAGYVLHFGIDLMFGCASLPGTDPKALAGPLSYLYHNHLAPEYLRPRAVPDRYVDMRILEPDAFDARRELVGLPPLVKGYLRLNGFVGDGAVVDHQFNTTDVCVLVKTDLVTDKYFKHYTRETDGRERPRSGEA